MIFVLITTVTATALFVQLNCGGRKLTYLERQLALLEQQNGRKP